MLTFKESPQHLNERERRIEKFTLSDVQVLGISRVFIPGFRPPMTSFPNRKSQSVTLPCFCEACRNTRSLRLLLGPIFDVAKIRFRHTFDSANLRGHPCSCERISACFQRQTAQHPQNTARYRIEFLFRHPVPDQLWNGAEGHVA